VRISWLFSVIIRSTHRNGHWLDFGLTREINLTGLNTCPITPCNPYYFCVSATCTSLPAAPTTFRLQRDFRSINKFELLSSFDDSCLFSSHSDMT